MSHITFDGTKPELFDKHYRNERFMHRVTHDDPHKYLIIAVSGIQDKLADIGMRSEELSEELEDLRTFPWIEVLEVVLPGVEGFIRRNPEFVKETLLKLIKKNPTDYIFFLFYLDAEDMIWGSKDIKGIEALLGFLISELKGGLAGYEININHPTFYDSRGTLIYSK